MTQPYEKSIGLKTIYLTFVRRFIAIIAIFLPIVLASYIVTSKIIIKTYQSSAALAISGNVIGAGAHSAIEGVIKSPSTSDKVASLLTIKHSDGSTISGSEILSGVACSIYTANENSLIITFQSNDQTIIKTVLNQLASTSVELLKESSTGYAGLSVYSTATEPVKNSKDNQYFLIGLAVGGILALGMPFIYEIVSDELYDKDDLTKLGIPAFEIKAVK